MTQAEAHKIIFEGPEDDSPETLRKLKGTFIAELNCSIEEVKSFFEKAPVTIYSTDDKDELHRVMSVLQHSGGKIYVDSLSEDSENQDLSDEDSSSTELEFTIELDDLATPEEIVPPREPKVYALNFNPDDEQPQFEAESPEDITSTATTDLSTPHRLSFDDEEEFSQKETEALKEDVFQRSEPARTLPPDVDLSLSFEDGTAELDLVEPDRMDPNVAGEEGVNWDLSFESEEQTKTAVKPHEIESSPNGDQKEAAPLTTEFGPESTAPTSIQENIPALEFSEEDSSFNDIELPPQIEDEKLLQSEEETVEAAPHNLMAFEEEEIEKGVDVIESRTIHNLETVSTLSTEQTESQTNLADTEVIDSPSTSLQENSEALNTKTEVFKEEEGQKEEEILETPLSPDPEQSQSKFKGSSNSNRIALVTIVITVLALANGYFIWANFLNIPETPQITKNTLESMIQAAVKQSKAAEQMSVPVEPIAPIVNLQGLIATSEGSVSWTLKSRENSILSGTLGYSGPKPRERTKLEIANNVPPIPWIHKVDLSKVQFSKGENGNSVAQASAKIYVEQEDLRYRLVGQATIVLAYDNTKDLLAGTLFIRNSDQKADGTPNYTVSGNDKNSLQISIETEFVAEGGIVESEEVTPDE